MDRATALEITTWAANEYAYIRRTGFKPSPGVPYSLEEIEEAVLTLTAPEPVLPMLSGRGEALLVGDMGYGDAAHWPSWSFRHAG
jgi:hypothetical protein